MESSVTTESSELPSLLRLTLDEYHHGLDTGALSTSDLTKAYLARIKEVDGEFRYILEINPGVLQRASELDQERSTSGRRG
jgi:amidase